MAKSVEHIMKNKEKSNSFSADNLNHSPHLKALKVVLLFKPPFAWIHLNRQIHCVSIYLSSFDQVQFCKQATAKLGTGPALVPHYS